MNKYLLGAILFAGLSLLEPISLRAAAPNVLPPGVIREGSLCNKKLIADASIAVAGKLAKMGYRYDVHRHTFRPYVVSMPDGAPGQRRWTERWVYSIEGKEVPVVIDFSEAGLGAADYTIRR